MKVISKPNQQSPTLSSMVSWRTKRFVFSKQPQPLHQRATDSASRISGTRLSPTTTNQQRQLAQLKPELSLRAFIKLAWHVVEPGNQFVPNWHLDCISEHLEACTFGQLRSLIINMPPRCMKSLSVAVFWPAWVWTFRPGSRWLFASYSEAFSTRDSMKCRRVIKSDWYQRRFGHIYTISRDQDAKMRFENSAAGFRLASSVAGMGAGEGGDFICPDDPHKVKEAESDVIRQGVVDWWFETMPTRFIDPKTVVKVVTMQRIKENDLSGEILSRELGYEHLCLPMRYEEGRTFYEVPIKLENGKRASADGTELPKDAIIGTTLQRLRPELRDPRKEDGELLWPQRLDELSVLQMEGSLLEYGTAGQLQQRPAPRGGGMLQRDWFKLVKAVPRDSKFVRYWDKAGTEGGTGARTAG